VSHARPSRQGGGIRGSQEEFPTLSCLEGWACCNLLVGSVRCLGGVLIVCNLISILINNRALVSFKKILLSILINSRAPAGFKKKSWY
jgi:hypothetical protein